MYKLDLPYDLLLSAPRLLDAMVYERKGAFGLAIYTMNGMIALRQELEATSDADAIQEAYALLQAWKGFDEETLETLGVKAA